MTDRERQLLLRLRAWTLLFILGLVLSGATAIPLETELHWLVKWTGAESLVKSPASTDAPGWAVWLVRVRDALVETGAKHPFLAYGYDWLAFGHFVIALAFVGAWRDPVRNIWLFDFGLMACALVIPFALIFGGARGIPLYWRLIDCSFGVIGAIPLWLCRRWTLELEKLAVSAK
ncbi:MAG: hypothetical protein HZA89_13875 [Verrucomicrobia bacterium]|nr:hypothetical protein [Verrucomicrobiota bacterium]